MLVLPWRGSAWSAAASLGGKGGGAVGTARGLLGVTRVAVAAGLWVPERNSFCNTMRPAVAMK